MKLVLFFVLALTGVASPVTYMGGDASHAAEVSFGVMDANTLQIRFANTFGGDNQVPTDVLTAFFFDAANWPLSVTPYSVVLGPGSVVLFGSTDHGGNVGGEWAYKCGLVGAPAACGVSSVGLGLFGPPDLFPGSNLQGPESPDGLQYGLLSAGDNPATGNTPMTGQYALIQNSVVITLKGNFANFDPLLNISYVEVQTGTGMEDPRFHLDAVPEPSSFSFMFLVGLVFGAWWIKPKIAHYLK